MLAIRCRVASEYDRVAARHLRCCDNISSLPDWFSISPPLILFLLILHTHFYAHTCARASACLCSLQVHYTRCWFFRDATEWNDVHLPSSRQPHGRVRQQRELARERADHSDVCVPSAFLLRRTPAAAVLSAAMLLGRPQRGDQVLGVVGMNEKGCSLLSQIMHGNTLKWFMNRMRPCCAAVLFFYINYNLSSYCTL